MNSEQAANLLARYCNDECTPAELELVEAIFSKLERSGQLDWTNMNKERITGELEQRVMAVLAINPDENSDSASPRIPVHRVHFMRRSFWRYAAALAALITGIWIYQQSRTPALLSQEKRFRNDLQPGSRRATLTLADGSQIAMTDTLAKLTIGEIKNQPKVSTTKGESFSLVLPDGTKIWLNSASSLHCAAGYGNGERRVLLTGEAYFEVLHDQKNPFVVQLPDGTLIKDIGTRFNIHAYNDEKVVRTTVLEGSVQVEAHGNQLALAPGEQAEYSAKKELKINEKVNLPGTVAWKNEQFLLDKTPIETIMQQVQRWYGAEIVYQDGKETDTTGYFGTLSRKTPVSHLLKMLEINGHVHFLIEGNKITVMK